MSNTNARWRWLALLAVFAMIVAACSSDTTDTTADSGDSGATTTTAAPGDTTDTTEAPPAATGYTYKMAIFSDPTTDNPWAALDTENDVWTNYVNPDGASLYGYQGPTYTLVPGIAEDDTPPEPVADGDAWSVTVGLRQDVTWSDGEAIDANDVAFTFNTVAKYDGLGGNFPFLWPLAADDDPATEEDESNQGVLSVEVVDDYTVKVMFNFEPGLAVWPFQVGTATIFPEHFWGPIVDANDSFEGLYAESGLGYPNAGAFNSAEREPGAFWRNESIGSAYYDAGAEYVVYDNGTVQYTRPDGVIEQYGGQASGDPVADYVEGPYADEVVFSLYSDQNAAVLALTDGEVDFLMNPLGLQRGLQQLVLSEPSLNVIVNEQNGYRYLSYNMRKFPMNEKSFREAIACRIDKEFMANTVLGGAAIAANSQVPPGNSFWYNPDVSAPCTGLSEQERFEAAVQILRDGGWTWSVDPVWSEDNRDVLPKGEGLALNGQAIQPLTLLAPGPGYDPLRATYSLFIEEWAVDLGIPLQAEPTGFSVIVDEVFAADEGALEWDMYILGWGLTPFPDHVFSFFETAQDSAGGGFNTPGYSNPEFDALATQFNTAKTLEEARDIIFAADAILAEDLPYVVLFTTPIIEAYRNTIEFPFTTTLDGIQNWGGLQSATRAAG
ncbi:MAG TPA: ABC transporter substrate-binding protein [Acidimicrobiia bacterium]